MKPFIGRLLRKTLTGVLLLPVLAVAGPGASRPAADQPNSLKELFGKADVVVLAQVRDTDYVYRREFPVEGSAYLKVLITYKARRIGDLIEVYEKGLHARECYFPNPTVFEEGRRYLLFLKSDGISPGRFRGMPQGCALDVLVDTDYQYVLRLPADGIALSDPLDEYARTFEFADPYALETDTSLPPKRRDELLTGGWLASRGDGFVYTRGLELSEVRKLMEVSGGPATSAHGDGSVRP